MLASSAEPTAAKTHVSRQPCSWLTYNVRQKMVTSLVFLALFGGGPAAVLMSVAAARRNPRREMPWDLAVGPLLAVTVWLALLAKRYGPQGLGSIVELVVLAATSVVLGILKIVFIDRATQRYTLTSAAYAVLMIGVAVGLRSFMPELQE